MDNTNKTLVFVINVDWYFRLHWTERADFFRSQGYTVHIISNFTNSEIKQELISHGFICHQITMKRKSVNFLHEIRVLLSLKKLLAEIKPDLIHCVTVKPNVYAGIINLIHFQKPIIYSITGLGAVFSSTSLKFTILRLLTRAFYKIISTTNSRFIFENSDDYQLFNQLGILKHSNGIVIKGAGIDLERFLPSPPPCNQTVLFAARLLKDKGLNHLVAAKKALSLRGLDFTLNVAGIIDNDVSAAIPLEQIERWNEAGVIRWLGNVSDMPNLIRENDIICLPTTYGEGVPRILIEAASCQRAIVTTNVVGCREIVSHGYNGLLVKAGDVNSLADALEQLLTKGELLEQFGKHGREKVKNEFSQEQVFNQTQEVYNKLLL